MKAIFKDLEIKLWWNPEAKKWESYLFGNTTVFTGAWLGFKLKTANNTTKKQALRAVLRKLSIELEMNFTRDKALTENIFFYS